MGKRIVIKVGTSTLTHANGGVNLRNMDRLARVLSDLKHAGNEVVLVSSGAIGVGAGKLHLRQKPTELRMKQAVAAIGQCELMHLYDKFFGDYGVTVGQILLIRENVDDPVQSQNLLGTFNALLELGVVPVVNENDSVSFEEIERDHQEGTHKVFGDNDTLSALVARLVHADQLVIFSDIDGLYDSDPHTNEDARLIAEVTEITDEIRDLAGGAGSAFGTGGMATKIQAAEIAMQSGCDLIITNGARPENLYDIAENRARGTLFRARKGACV